MTTRTVNLRLRLNRSEEKLFQRILDCCRYVYNESLDYQRSTWIEDGLKVSSFDAMKHLTEMLEEHPELRLAQRHCLNDAAARATIAMNRFHKETKAGLEPGFPRYRGEGRYDSFTYTDPHDYEILPDRILRLGKIGQVHFRGQMDRFLKRNGTRKTCTVKRDGTGRWTAHIVFVVDDYLNNTETFTKKNPVGVDVNLANLAATSEGVFYGNTEGEEGIIENIKKIQRKMSRHEEDSPKHEKYRRQLCHSFKRLNNRRKDNAHKVSRDLVDNHSFIAFEDLDISGMIKKAKSRKMRRSMHSAAWRRIFTYTSYKAEGAGIEVVRVNPANTSSICSRCGNDVPKPLSERTHRCDRCGLVMDRDVNAAVNILRRGLGCRPLPSTG